LNGNLAVSNIRKPECSSLDSKPLRTHPGSTRLGRNAAMLKVQLLAVDDTTLFHLKKKRRPAAFQTGE